MVNINVCVGAAGFALGLSLAGLGAAGAASADSPKTDAARADSTAAAAGPTRQASKATKRMTARGGTIPARPSAAATRRPAGAIGLPSTSSDKSDRPAVPIGKVAATAPAVPLPADPVPTEQPADTSDLAGPLRREYPGDRPRRLRRDDRRHRADRSGSFRQRDPSGAARA